MSHVDCRFAKLLPIRIPFSFLCQHDMTMAMPHVKTGSVVEVVTIRAVNEPSPVEHSVLVGESDIRHFQLGKDHSRDILRELSNFAKVRFQLY